MGIRILIVEDEAELADFVVRGLREEGFIVEHAADGELARAAMRSGTWDLVVLDWWLPGEDGLLGAPAVPAGGRDRAGAVPDGARCRRRPGARARRRRRRLPVQAVRLRRAAGPRPRLVRRRDRTAELAIAHGDVSVDLATQRARRAGRPLDLTAKEQALLIFFLRHPGQVLSRTRIYDHVWDESFDGLSNTLEVHVMELRRKLEAHGPRVIHTVRGRGYLYESIVADGGAMSLTGRFSALFLAALGLALVGLLDGAVRLGADLPGSSGARAPRRGAGHPGGGGRDPSRRRGVGAAGAGHHAGPGIGGRSAALDRPRRPRAPRSIARATWPTRIASRTSWRAPIGRARRAGWWIAQGEAWRIARRVLRPERLRGLRRSEPRRPRRRPPAPDPAGAIHPALVLIVVRPARPDGGDARHAGLAPGRPERGDLAGGGTALPRALAAGAPAAVAAGRTRRGGSTPPTPAGPWRRPAPATSSTTWAVRSTTCWPGCTSPTSGSGGSAAMPRTSCGPR